MKLVHKINIIVDNKLKIGHISGTWLLGPGTRFTWLNFVGHLPFNETQPPGPDSRLIMIATRKANGWRSMIVITAYVVVFVLQSWWIMIRWYLQTSDQIKFRYLNKPGSQGQDIRFIWLNFFWYLLFNRTRPPRPGSWLIMIITIKAHVWYLMVVLTTYIVAFMLNNSNFNI